MENPQAQMQQGQAGPSPEQMQQGAPQGPPQQGGQDPQMEQIMQMVQQMMQQGVQPVEAAAELLGQQVPPEIVMQVFVQLGLPEQEAQAAIEQAMQGGQQPQGQGEEQMQGQASNPQEGMTEQGAPPPDQGGQPSPAEEIQMRYGGRMPRRLRSYAEGGDNQEMQAVMQQVQDMMSQGSDARQVMEQIQAAVQQGQISPEVGATVMEQLGGMQQATDPQGNDAAMTAQSQDPQMVDPNMAAPEAQMMKFGGNLKKLMSRAYGGPAVAPGTDSKTYAQDRTSMFVGAVKNSAYKSTLDDEFPSLGGNQMAYGGSLPKATNGINMSKDGKLTIDPTQFKSEAEYKAAALDWNMDPANKDNQVTGELLKTNTWKAPEPTYEAGKNYNYDPATKQWKTAPASNQFQFAEGDVMGQDNQGSYVTRKDGSMMRVPSMQNQGAQTSYSQTNPVGYQNPINNGFWGNIAASASPFGRMVAGIGTNNNYDPRITGANLPGGMSGAQFLGAVGQNGLVPGMAGNVAGQNWRIGEAEKFKEGSIWKGNRRKGVRYQIDWGDTAAAAANPAAPQNNPLAGNSTPMGPQGQIVDPAILGNQGTPVLDSKGNQLTSDGSNMMWNSGNMPTIGSQGSTTNQPSVSTAVTQPPATVVANQNTVAPGSTNVVNPASEVNATDQTVTPTVDNSALNVTKVTDEGIKGTQDGKLVTSDYKGDGRNRYDRQSDRQVRREENQVERQDNRQIRQDTRAIKKENRQAGRAIKNMLNEDADQSQMPEVMQKAFQQQAYGGNVDPVALENAIALINRAFGGRIPKAVDGVDLGSEDTDANKIPDYLQAENLPANEPSPFNKGTVEQSAGKKLDINWNQVGAAAGDMYMNAAGKVTNFMNKMNAVNPERDMAKLSALNRPSNTYDTMKQGLYDQAGNFIPNDIGNQVLNPTDTNYNNQRQIFSYGGKVYEIGGEVDLEDDEMEQLAAAGFKLSRV
jgi:hypothetical protein